MPERGQHLHGRQKIMSNTPLHQAASGSLSWAPLDSWPLVPEAVSDPCQARW
jgi:hypothetical protein